MDLGSFPSKVSQVPLIMAEAAITVGLSKPRTLASIVSDALMISGSSQVGF